MNEFQKKVLTLEEASLFLGYAKSTIYKLTSSGILPYSKPNGKKIYFERDALEKWMLSNKSQSNIDRECISATYVASIYR
jgi:excisionase family DNA binding protein